MSSNTYKNLRLFFIVFFASAFVLGIINFVSAQTTTTNTMSEKVNEVQDQVASNTGQIDATTVVSGVGVVGAGIAVAKQLLDQKTNKKRDRTTDGDAGRFIILQSKFYQAKKLYPELSDSELLDLPVSNNPFATQTFGQAFTTEADLWADGNASYWGFPKPNMSVPTRTTVDAVKASTAAPPTQPPLPKGPDNTPSSSSSQTPPTPQSAASSSSSLSTTVGK